MIYLNHAGTSWPKPAAVIDAVASVLKLGPASSADLFKASRADVCRFLGIRDPERFLFTTGCTAALAVALSDLPWQAGDVLITSALEHHALARPVQHLVEHRGVRHEIAPYRTGEPVDLDRVHDLVRRGGVRLIAVSHASNVTGEVLPMAELVRLAHDHGALFLLDAAQTVGILPIDVGALGVDMLTLAGHKGPLGPQGIGGLWAAPGVAFESPVAACEIGADRSACVSFPGYCDVGSVNLAGAAGVAAGFRFLEERGIEATGGHARHLAGSLLAELKTRRSCHVYGGDGQERTAALSLRIDGLAIERAESFFLSRNVVVRAGQHCAPMALDAIGAPAGTVRISFGASNTEEDVEAVLAALDAVA